MVTTDLLNRALVEEATKKSGLIWVRGGVPVLDGDAVSAPTRALWHVWIEGAAYVVGDGPGEQPLPGLLDGGDALVTVRSKDKGGRLVAWPAKVVELAPGSPEWQTAVTELKGKRLNAPDAGCCAWNRRARRPPCRRAPRRHARCRRPRQPVSRSPRGCRGCCSAAASGSGSRRVLGRRRGRGGFPTGYDVGSCCP
jgi:hypothetical protein